MLDLISPQYPGVPSVANVVNVQPTERAKPGINFFIPSKHAHSIRSLSKFLYLYYDDESPLSHHYSMSDVVRQIFPDTRELTMGAIDDARDLGYNVIALSRFADYGFRVYGENLVTRSGYSPYPTIPLTYILMKTLSIVSWAVRDLIETRQHTFDGIESEQQIALCRHLYAPLADLRSSRKGRLPRLSDLKVLAPEEYVQMSLTFNSFSYNQEISVGIRLHRDTPTLWTVSSDRPELLNLLLDTATFAYPQLSRFSEALVKPHFYLDESVILTIEP
jgi:hypothetical protein